jgi:predicted CXXCH cytochrome family protein
LTGRYFTWALFLFFVVVLTYGCEGKSSYKVLSFFFDGVPVPSESKVAGTEATGGEEAKPKNIYREHGPFAARQCHACHMAGSNKLVLPIQKLCFKCHTLDLTKKYIHGPLASGGCKVCHDPHGSAHPFFLVADPRVFCLYCHKKSDIEKNEVHRDMKGQCTDCHDAHSSDKRYMLK